MRTNNRVQLSIVIPTIGRIDFIKRSLIALTKQTITDHSLFEVCIFDNASIDCTNTILSDFKASFAFYHKRSSIRLPIDRSHHEAASMATGDYIWFLGDDDIPEHDAVETILKTIAQHNPVALIVNGNHTHTGKARSDHSFLPVSNGSNVVFTSTVEFAKAHFTSIKFGCLVARKEIIAVDWNRYSETMHAYSGALWEMACNSNTQSPKNYIVIQKPLVTFIELPKTYLNEYATLLYKKIPEFTNLLPTEINAAKLLFLANHRDRLSKSRTIFGVCIRTNESLTNILKAQSHLRKSLILRTKTVLLYPLAKLLRRPFSGRLS